jgi:2,5-diketo-D-gluconate reductase A
MRSAAGRFRAGGGWKTGRRKAGRTGWEPPFAFEGGPEGDPWRTSPPASRWQCARPRYLGPISPFAAGSTRMSEQPTITFHDGRAIPQLGLGVWRTPDDIAVEAVATALRAGYRHIDTASAYENERGVGEGLRRSGLDRNDVFITTKLKNDDQGFDSTLRAFDASAKRLGLDAIDLYLIHWPSPWRGAYLDTWKALVRLHEEGRARSIGVSNFAEEHLERIVGETGVVPVLNQIELHPRFQQRQMREVDAGRSIVTESWSPLGQGGLLEDPAIGRIAAKHGRTPAQVIIRWHLDSGLVVIPKSVTPSRIESNFDVFGFELDAEDRAAIDGMDSADGRIGPDPTTAKF